MDEILIEEKRYVSSKQAAKITGYAKDYIGQLCREGRVPARLVGRSWYVLESAIQDHRFGNPEEPRSTTIEEKEEQLPKVSKTWESPRYEPDPVETLPAADHLKARKETVDEETSEAVSETIQSVHDSWNEWFNHVAARATSTIETSNKQVVDINCEPQGVEPALEEDTEVEVPIHVTDAYSKADERLPEVEDLQENRVHQQVQTKYRGRIVTRLTKAIGVILAVAFVALAAIGSGYFDSYITSNSRGGTVSGINVYNK
jgi:hypothetical protein